MIPALVALGARETGNDDGYDALHAFAFSPVYGTQPSLGEVAAALTALVSAGCSLTQPDEYGMVPMDFAASKGNAPVVTALLSHGVAATTASLVHAVKHPDTVRLLLAAGAPVGGLVRLADFGELLLAAWAPVGGVVRLADFGDTGTPLMKAAWRASLESVQLLLVAGASVSRVNSRGTTALMFSVLSKCGDAAPVLSVVEALLAAGSSVNSRDLAAGATALHHLASTSHGQPWAADVARLLRDSGADGRIKNDAGATPAQCVPVGARSGELFGLLLAAEA